MDYALVGHKKREIVMKFKRVGMSRSTNWVLSAVMASILAFLAAPDTRAQDRFEITSYKDVEGLFERLGYTPGAWKKGIREVPRIYVTNIPERWRSKYSKEVSVRTKKRLFFRLLGPIVLLANERIMENRTRLERLKAAIHGGAIPIAGERKWIGVLAARYRLPVPSGVKITVKRLDDLLHRVDVIPPSLALSQSAEESGWGTSRFADLGNALFGQWTFGGKGIKPKSQRKELGDHRIAAFDSPIQSVEAYMLNINTHPAYNTLRDKRARFRREGNSVSGTILAGTLVKYSERGEEYVKSLRAIMRVNRLGPTDDATLSSKPPMYLVPVGAGAK